MRRTLLLSVLLCVLCLFPLAALAGTGEIHGFVYVSTDNAPYREGARMVSDVNVTLYRLEADGSETRLARVTTRSDGFYGFTELEPGSYRLRASAPEGYQFDLPRENGSVMLPSVGSESFSMLIQVGAGEQIGNAHIGLTRGSTYIKVIAFEDTNQNGGRSTTELLLRGVSVTLYYEMDGELVPIAVEKTDMNGEAMFLHMTPGTYRVGAVLPAPYIIGPLGPKINLWYNCVPPCDSNEGVTGPVTAPKGDSLGVGVGAVSTGSLTGRVWWDENMDGRKAGEGGYAGATVRLSSDLAGVSRETRTDASGAYRFESLLAGEYTLTVELPETAMFTLPGGDSLLTEGYAFRASRTVTVTDQTEGRVPDIGVMPVTSLAVQLYNDVNVNGIFDAGEPAFAGASLAVLKNGIVYASAASDGSGLARIPVLRGGDTAVQITLPDGQAFTVAGEQNDFADLTAMGSMTRHWTLSHGEETLLYAGVTLPAAVSGILFNDENLSGVMEAGEQGLSGFTVQAVNAAGEVAAETVTDDAGAYSFRSLLPTAHTIRFLLTDAYVFTDLSETGAQMENCVASQTPEYGDTALLALSPGQSLTGICGGIFRSATVSGQVLLDTGIAALPAEGGMAGVLVELLDTQGTPVSDTTTALTDANGAFYLKGALPGSYRLRFTLPAHAAYTDASIEEGSIVSDLITLRVADDIRYGTLRAIPTGSLSGMVYRDGNLNGQYDAGEAALPDVRIHLDHNELGLVYETTVQADGSYAFPQLRPGTYTLTMTLPDGLCFAHDPTSPVAAQVGNTGVSTFTVEIGEQQPGRNIAAAQPARLSGTVYFDLQNNGLRESGDAGAAGVTLSFANLDCPLSYTVQTDGDGRFLLPAMVPGAYTLRATLDSGCTVADSNTAQLMEGYWTSRVRLNDGMVADLQYPILRFARVAGHVWSLDGSLNGVAGRTVTLYREGAEQPLAVTQTDASGAFAFGQLKPGQYKLTCDLPDARYQLARPADQVMYTGGTPDVPVGYYDYFSVAMGDDMAACDIGIGAMGALGDTAWLDLNGNGLKDGDEPCLPGVAIQLYQYGELAAQAVTDNQGHYLVENLYPGAYTVRVTYPAEVKPTRRRTDYPLAASVLTPTEGSAAETEGVIVPSAGRSLNCDFGFVLRQEGIYPAELGTLYSTDWSFGGKRK